MPDSNGTNGTNGTRNLEIRFAKLQTVVHDSIVRQLEVLVSSVEKLDNKFDMRITLLSDRLAKIDTELTLINRVVSEWDEYKKEAKIRRDKDKQRENELAAANTRGKWSLAGTILTVIGLIVVALLK